MQPDTRFEERSQKQALWQERASDEIDRRSYYYTRCRDRDIPESADRSDSHRKGLLLSRKLDLFWGGISSPTQSLQ